MSLEWLPITQAQYQNRDKGCEEIPRQNNEGSSGLKIKQTNSF